MEKKLENTRYHTPENGWFDHEKYKIAYPFATGQIAIDTEDENLSEDQIKGKQLFFESCVSCHDRGVVKNAGNIWEGRPLSWPRNNYSHKLFPKQALKLDGVSGASSYAKHDIKKTYIPASEAEKKGQLIFQNNCAFCHAPDGSGKNWVGQFIEPHPKNFTQKSIQETYSKQQLKNIIANGKKDTAMPAWRYVLNEEQIGYVISYMWLRFK
ncbi:c-type cytochrome [bacterium]|nr:c-type cytochrome [bacterium]